MDLLFLNIEAWNSLSKQKFSKGKDDPYYLLKMSSSDDDKDGKIDVFTSMRNPAPPPTKNYSRKSERLESRISVLPDHGKGMNHQTEIISAPPETSRKKRTYNDIQGKVISRSKSKLKAVKKDPKVSEEGIPIQYHTVKLNPSSPDQKQGNYLEEFKTSDIPLNPKRTGKTTYLGVSGNQGPLKNAKNEGVRSFNRGIRNKK